MLTCKNCGHTVSGKFCSNCGQSSDTGRISKRTVLREILKLFANVQSGKFFLTKELFLHPGDVTRGYLEGKRKKYYNPVQYYLGTTAITIFLMLKLDIQNIMINDLHESSVTNEIFGNFISMLYKYFNLAEFLILPLLSLYSYLFFRRSGYNYAEFFIVNTYASAQRQLVYLLFIFLIYLFPGFSDLISNISILVLSAVFIRFYADLFKNERIWLIIFKTSIVLVLFYLSILLILAGIFLIYH